MSKKNEKLKYTVDNFKHDVGSLEEYELEDLVFEYPTYGKDWRPAIIEGIKKGKSIEQIFADKLQTLEEHGLGPNGPHSRNAMKRNIPFKLRRAAMRIWYLRHRQKGKTQREANALVWKKFPDFEQNSIAFETRKKPWPAKK